MKALSEEFGQSAGSENNFQKMVKIATTPDFGFLYITFGLKVRFFNSYKSEFQITEADDSNSQEQNTAD